MDKAEVDKVDMVLIVVVVTVDDGIENIRRDAVLPNIIPTRARTRMGRQNLPME